MIYGYIITVTGNINFIFLICSSLCKSNSELQTLIMYLFIFLFIYFAYISIHKHIYAAYREKKEDKEIQLLLK